MLDLTNVKEEGALLPVGSYTVSAVKADLKDTKNGLGQYINLKFAIVGGDFSGRNLFHMFNIKNENAQAVSIGLSQLKSFMLAAGAKSFVLDSVTQLEGLCCKASVKQKSDSFGDKNIITGFSAIKEVEIGHSEAPLPF